MEGFERGRNLDKMGLHAQDTAELSFTDVHVPKSNLLGAPGSGFVSLMENLPQERISIACIAVAAIEHVLDLCLAYAKEREAFGKPIGKFQHNRFVLAEMATEAHIARVFVNDCVLRLNAGTVDTSLASMAKWWTTELQKRVVDAGVQLHGGYGYMSEYPISKAYTDSRIQTIYGGHDRDPEGDHRPDAGALTGLLAQSGSSAGTIDVTTTVPSSSPTTSRLPARPRRHSRTVSRSRPVSVAMSASVTGTGFFHSSGGTE